VILVGAGDIAKCGTTGARATARLISRIDGFVFTAGDNAYPNGSANDFRRCYDPAWGRFRGRTFPAPGNHDFHTPKGRGYFDYFGGRAGKPGRGWYSVDLGGWHLVVLNSNCDLLACGRGSAQLRWLEADLAASRARCTIAVWHHPLFSSGMHGDASVVRPFWDVLAAAGAEIVVNGHDHDYERFAPQTPAGRRDRSTGIREFVVGTGGAPLRAGFRHLQANSEVHTTRTHGVLVLTLQRNGYRWRFRRSDGAPFSDQGSGRCHGPSGTVAIKAQATTLERTQTQLASVRIVDRSLTCRLAR
jgi:3',5'-cyclic AMP phosphodiesterase CpdA